MTDANPHLGQTPLFRLRLELQTTESKVAPSGYLIVPHALSGRLLLCMYPLLTELILDKA